MSKEIHVDEALTRKMADLARLELSDAEVVIFTSQLEHILGYFEKLQEVKVEGVDPLISPIELETPFREDHIIPSLVDSEGKPKVLQSAPDVLDDGYKVPPIL